MSPRDKKRGEDMLKEDFVQARPRWVEEIELMLSTGMKAEIQALAHEDIQFMTNFYLPNKIHSGDWV
jgi:DNA topoisomerase VI subunit A